MLANPCPLRQTIPDVLIQYCQDGKYKVQRVPYAVADQAKQSLISLGNKVLLMVSMDETKKE